MGKSKIKTRKKRMEEYSRIYDNIPKDDPVERVMYCIGDKLTEDKVKKIIERKNKILQEVSYSCIKFTYYEYPAGSNRPRHRSFNGMISSYVPNAKENKEYFKKLVEKLMKDIKLIHTPIYITLDIYYEMPSSASIEEQVLFEAKVLSIIVPIDVDNVFKTYSDQMLLSLIINDDLIHKLNINSYYSFLPRLEMHLYYEDQFTSKYIYNKIIKRKIFKQLTDHIDLAVLI